MALDPREKKILDNLSGRLIRSEDVESEIRKELLREQFSDISPSRILLLAIRHRRIESCPDGKFRIK